MIEENLENFRKAYIGSAKTYDADYAQLASRLGKQKRPHTYAARTLVAFISVILLAGSAVGAAQAAKPKEVLYPVKILSENIYSQVTGNQEIKIERRAEDVINTSENGESFEKAAEQYQQAVDEAKAKAEGSDEDEKERFRKKLEEQEKRFQEAQSESAKSKTRLEGVLQQTRKIRGEVKGAKDNPEKNSKDDNRRQEDERDRDREKNHDD